MAKAKQLNVPMLGRLVKELNATGELIKAKQDEKQSIMNDFDKEKSRYRGGKISESTLVSSAAKTNKELMRLDKEVRNAIVKFKKLADRLKVLSQNQAPRVFRAHVSGVSGKKKGKAKKKVVKKGSKKAAKKPAKKKASVSGLRAIMRREKALDRKYQK